jgi:hypothetical protein
MQELEDVHRGTDSRTKGSPSWKTSITCVRCTWRVLAWLDNDTLRLLTNSALAELSGVHPIT